jgi:serine protease Do
MTVIAIGNPLGFGFTVTHGIVSARDRDITETPLDSFLQIDAPINPGNSGGPLFNQRGEVIGVNTALYQVDETGGSVGLNFAIPGNDVQFLVNQLKQYGRVRLGTTGAVVQNLNQDMADAVGLSKPEGVVLTYIPPGSPAADAKLQVGDIILQVTGHDIPNVRRLRRTTGALGVGDTVPFLVLRDGQKLTIPVTLGEAASDMDPTNKLLIDAQPAERVLRPDLGLTAEAVTDANRPKYGIPAEVNGIVITNVMADTMGADLGLSEGDVLMRINSTDLTSMASFHDAVAKARAAGRRTMMVLVLDHVGTHWMAIPVPPPA